MLKHGADEGGFYYARVGKDTYSISDPHDHKLYPYEEAEAKTPAAAWVAAILRALASKEERH